MKYNLFHEYIRIIIKYTVFIVYSVYFYTMSKVLITVIIATVIFNERHCGVALWEMDPVFLELD